MEIMFEWLQTKPPRWSALHSQFSQQAGVEGRVSKAITYGGTFKNDDLRNGSACFTALFAPASLCPLAHAPKARKQISTHRILAPLANLLMSHSH